MPSDPCSHAPEFPINSHILLVLLWSRFIWDTNRQSWEKSQFSKVQSSVKSLSLEYRVKSSDTHMQIVKVTSQVKSWLLKASEVEVKCQVIGIEVYMK